ncbi:CcmD family protein [Chitinophaga lutea]|uniref:CcmD family protein n=1 Tax=Chitinophaga lutea TaxID=2488634 RepID=A0A3N4PPV3_9BACT|nr:CcmD family protein [Chitinophaga lutea]RPE09778.1 CcmD family protein [Chitinophaga lutea]
MANRLGLLLFAGLMFLCTTVLGQDTTRVISEASQQQNTETGPVNEFFRSDSKIYVAVGILVIIFICIVLYLVRLDRRLTKLEKE